MFRLMSLFSTLFFSFPRTQIAATNRFVIPASGWRVKISESPGESAAYRIGREDGQSNGEERQSSIPHPRPLPVGEGRGEGDVGSLELDGSGSYLGHLTFVPRRLE